MPQSIHIEMFQFYFKTMEDMVMAKPRKQTYTMDMYLRKIRDKDICDNADVQRMAGAWKNGQMNELIFTVLTEDYIPPIILGEEESSQLWIIDGLQRTSSLMRYRYGNQKITSAIENSVIPYRTRRKDDNGAIMLDGNGNILWEDVEFSIRNKTYGDLPDELKKKFNEYQIETVIHEECNTRRISTLIKRYNNHTSMNTAQRAFTHIDHFAKDVRRILDTGFFTEHDIFTENEKVNGTVERVVLESVMCMFHLDHWKKSPADVARYLNINSDREEFRKLGDNLCRLADTDELLKKIFTVKDSFIWLSLYNKFSLDGYDDKRFSAFLKAFDDGLWEKPVGGRRFNEVDKEGSTKDKTVIMSKLHILEKLMYEFLSADKEDSSGETEFLGFLKENVDGKITAEDIGYYTDNLEAWTIGIKESSKMNDRKNRPSMTAIAVYASQNEADCDDETMTDWFADYEARNPDYIQNQKDNYLHMKGDLDQYVRNKKQEMDGSSKMLLSGGL